MYGYGNRKYTMAALALTDSFKYVFLKKKGIGGKNQIFSRVLMDLFLKYRIYVHITYY